MSSNQESLDQLLEQIRQMKERKNRQTVSETHGEPLNLQILEEKADKTEVFITEQNEKSAVERFSEQFELSAESEVIEEASDTSEVLLAEGPLFALPTLRDPFEEDHFHAFSLNEEEEYVEEEDEPQKPSKAAAFGGKLLVLLVVGVVFVTVLYLGLQLGMLGREGTFEAESSVYIDSDGPEYLKPNETLGETAPPPDMLAEESSLPNPEDLSTSLPDAEESSALTESSSVSLEPSSKEESSKEPSSPEKSEVTSKEESGKEPPSESKSETPSKEESSKEPSSTEKSEVTSKEEAGKEPPSEAKSETPSKQESSKPVSSEASSKEPAGKEESSVQVAKEQLMVTYKGVNQKMDADKAVNIWLTGEIGESFPLEAAKAQALAAYTYIKRYNQAGSYVNIGSKNPQGSASVVGRAIAAVSGKAIYVGNSLAFTPWFSMSIGVTLNSEDVWSSPVSNLKSVKSEIEIGNKTMSWNPYAKSTKFSKADFKSMLESEFSATLPADPANWVIIKSYDATVTYKNRTIGYVEQCAVGNKTVSGRSFREKMGLRSAAFEVTYDAVSSQFTLTTFGYGHGCGLSQVGALLYAQKGWTYEQILKHYYTGITIR